MSVDKSNGVSPRSRRSPAVSNTQVMFTESHAETKLSCLRERIEQGEYQVDPKAVADAIVRRLQAEAAARVAGQQI